MDFEEFDPKKLKRNLQSKLSEYKRVLKISEKPDWDEFSMSAKITGAGIILIGVIGFVFYLLKEVVLDSVVFA